MLKELKKDVEKVKTMYEQNGNTVEEIENKKKKNEVLGLRIKLKFPWWLSRLRNWHCHVSGSGSVPNPGTSTYHRWDQKQKCQNYERRQIVFQV